MPVGLVPVGEVPGIEVEVLGVVGLIVSDPVEPLIVPDVLLSVLPLVEEPLRERLLFFDFDVVPLCIVELV